MQGTTKEAYIENALEKEDDTNTDNFEDVAKEKEEAAEEAQRRSTYERTYGRTGIEEQNRATKTLFLSLCRALGVYDRICTSEYLCRQIRLHFLVV